MKWMENCHHQKNQILVYDKPEIAEKLNQDLDELMKTGLNDFSTKRKLK